MNGWAVYYNPRDYPGCWVARQFMIVNGRLHATERCIVTNQGYRDLKTMLAPEIVGKVRFMRDPRDPPQVVETWL